MGTSSFTRRSVVEVRRSTNPRSSSRSARAVAYDASQCMDRASSPSRRGSSALSDMSDIACGGVRPSCCPASSHWARRDNEIPTSIAHASAPGPPMEVTLLQIVNS